MKKFAVMQFTRQAAAWSLLLVSCAPLVSDDTKQDEADKEATAQNSEVKAEHLKSMRMIAEGVALTAGTTDPRPAELIPEPLFRFSDPARDFSDGSVWGWGTTGRPAALMCVALHELDGGRIGWLTEFNSLATDDESVSALIPYAGRWATRKPGIELRAIPDAPAAESRPARRTRQIKELARKFTGSEFFSKAPGTPAERYELRLLTQPIHRYADPKTGLVDGAIFLLSYGSNPEVVLLVELHGTEKQSEWKYGLTRVSYAENHIEYDGREVWVAPHIQGTAVTDPYWLTLLPETAGKK